MKMGRYLVPLAVLALVAGACGKDNGASKAQVSVLTAMEPQERDALQAVVDKQINNSANYKAEIEAASDFEEQVKIRMSGGNPPEVISYPQPGSVVEQAKAGKIKALEDLGFDMKALEATFGSYFLSLGEYNGKHYGMPTNINLKSMIWYPKAKFDAKGYQVPKSWDELLALTDKIKADGSTPWCAGFESGSSTGWPATDWLEDIVLRTAGTDTYDKWVKHQIPFNDPSVAHALDLFGKALLTEGNVLGGASQSTSIAFKDSPKPMFDDPPKCWLHRHANFINAFFPDTAKAGTDYDWFPFPMIDKDGVLFGGELSVVTKDTPEVRDFIKRFASKDVQCAQGGTPATSRISPNVEVGKECYANQNLGRAADVLTSALKKGTGRFDASDMMPSAVGSGSFWTGMVKYLRGEPGPQVLDEIEKSWPST